MQGNSTKDYVLDLTYEKGGLTDDVVVLLTANHYVAVIGCIGYLIALEDGTSRGDRSCTGGSGEGSPQDPPISHVRFLPAHHLKPGEKSYRYNRLFTVVRPRAGSASLSFKAFALSPEPITPGVTVEGTLTAAAPFKVYQVAPSFAQDIITAYLEDSDPKGKFLWVRGGSLKWTGSDSASEDNLGQGVYALELQTADDNSYHLLIGGSGPYRLHVDRKPLQTVQSGSYDVTLSYKEPTDVRVLNGRKGDKFTLTAVGEELEIGVRQDQRSISSNTGDILTYFSFHPNTFGPVSREFTLTNDEPVYIETLFPGSGTRDQLRVHLMLAGPQTK